MKEHTTFWPLAWQTSLKLIGRRPLIITTTVLSLFLLLNLLPDAFSNLPMLRPPRLIETIAPLLIGLLAAFLFSPEDEPGLELLATAARPLPWLPLERLLLLLAQLGTIALLASLLGATIINPIEINLWQLTGRWLIPTLALVSLALCGTLITRHGVLGTLWVAIVWWVMLFPADGLLAGRPYLWPFHLYLQPDHPHYLLNRLFWAITTIALLLIALRQLRDTERLLGGKTAGQNRRPSASAAFPSQPTAATNPVPNNDRPHFLSQLLAVALNEHRLHWRRRIAMIILLFPCLICLLVTIYLIGQGNSSLPASLQEQNTIALLLVAWLPLYVSLQALYPVVADAIVRDRQLGTHELLETVPLPPAIYLLGKILGAWYTILLVLTGAMIAIGLGWWLLIGPYNLSLYLQMALLGALPLALINTGLIIMLSVGLNSRRQAALAGTGLTIFCIFTMFLISSDPLLNIVNPARPALLHYFLRQALPMLPRFATFNTLLWTITGGLAQLILAWLLAWLWLRDQEPYST